MVESEGDRNFEKKLLYIVTRQMLGFIEMFIFEKKKKEGERTAGNIKKP